MPGILNSYKFASTVSGATLTIPSGAVSADLTDFVVMVDLADMPAEFWAEVAPDGGDIRVKAGATNLPVDVVMIDTTAETGRLYFKSNLLAASDNVFTIEAGSGAAAPAPGDAIGRNAVWSDFHKMFDAAAPWIDRTGNGVGLLSVRLPGYRFGTRSNVLTIPNSSSSNYTQGVTSDETHYYVTQTNYLYKYDNTWTLVSSDSNPINSAGLSALCDHCSDLCYHDGKLYIPMTNDNRPSRPTNEYIAVFDAATLAHIENFALPTDASTASICYVPTVGEFWMVDYWDGIGKIQRYDASFNLLGEIIPNWPIDTCQGIAYFNDRLYLTSGSTRHTYEMFLDGTVIRIVDTWFSESRQGIHIMADTTVVCGAGAGSGANYIYTQAFYDEATPAGSLPDWLSYGDIGSQTTYSVANGVDTFTVWTMGASIYAFSKSTLQSQSYLSYMNHLSSSDASRETMAYRGASDRLATWNNSDTWLVDSGAVMAITTEYRTHVTFNGTTDRKLWINGTLSATDTGTSQRPTGTGQGLLVGRGVFNSAIDYPGRVNFIYLRNGLLSADWIAAEADNWMNPGSFYAVV